MTGVVNLNRHRKRVKRAEASLTAAQNRARSGQSRAERDALRTHEARLKRQHDQHHLNDKDGI